MGLLDAVGPGQRKLLMIGVPVAAAAALWSIHKKSGGAASSGTTTPTAMPSTAVIGAGQLADFEQNLTDAYNHLAGTVATLKLDPPAPPAPPPPQVIYVHDATVPTAPVPATNWGNNDPSVNPLVSPAPPIQLHQGDTLPAASGTGQRYINPDGYPVTYG